MDLGCFGDTIDIQPLSYANDFYADCCQDKGLLPDVHDGNIKAQIGIKDKLSQLKVLRRDD